MPSRETARRAGVVLGVAAAYVLLGRAGLLLAIPPGSIAVVWPSTGLALAAVVACGAPAVAGTLLGAFAVGLWFTAESGATGGPWAGAATAGVIAVGTTAQAWAAARFLRALLGPTGLPRGGADAARYAGVVATTFAVGATVGVTAMVAVGLVPVALWASSWTTWWLADVAAALVVTPALLVARQARTGHVGLRDLVFPAVGVGVGVTGVLFHLARGLGEQRAEARFAADCRTVAAAVERELGDRFRQVESVALFHGASEHVGARELEAFVAPYFARSKGLRALSLNAVVRGPDRAAYEAAMRREVPGFGVTEQAPDGLVPASERDAYYPVQYIEPLGRNRRARGFDLGSEPTRRAAIERMVATRRPAATAPIRLVQETASQRSVLLFWPLYGRAIGPGEAPLVAFVSGVVSAGDLLDAALGHVGALPLAVRLYDGWRGAEQTLLAARPDPDGPDPDRASPSLAVAVEHGDVAWTIACEPADAGAYADRSALPWVLLLGGGTLTLLLAVTLRSRADAQSATLRELAEQQRGAEARLREQEALLSLQRVHDATAKRLESVVLSTSDAVIIADRSGRICTWNPGAEHTFGHTPGEAAGMSVGALFPERHREEWQQTWARIASDDGPPRLAYTGLVGLRRDGRELPVDVSVSRWREGEDTFVGAIVRDVAEREGLEESLRHSQKMEAVGRLAGGVAHDFNNLLTVIVSASDLLYETLPAEGESHGLVREIGEAARRASGLTRQLLAFSRKQVLSPVVLDPNRLIQDMLGMLRRLIGEDIRLVTALDPAIGRVRVDPTQLTQVIMNLALNARDAMPRGGAITIGTSPAALEDAGPAEPASGRSRAQPHVLLSVRDTGTGIDEETRSHIFEPFFTTKESGHGTGLGLATVHGIVAQSGGRIEVESTPGLGTTFRILLPCVAPEDAAPVPEQRSAGRGAKEAGATILLVEDDDAVRRAEKRILESVGHAVVEARNGAEALALANATLSPIHLLVTDLVMPAMNGRELSGHLLRMHPEARILFVSGYPDRVLGPRGVLPDGASFLEKPFAPDTLITRVREILATAG